MLERVAKFSGPALVLWSLFVWVNRLRNMRADGEGIGIERNDELLVEAQGRFNVDTSRLIAVALAVFFVTASLWALRSAYGLWRDGAADPLTCVSGAVLALAVANLVVWPIRAYGILGSDEWTGAFKTVHTLLALVSVVLGLLVLFHRYGRAGNSRSVRNRQSVADPV